MTDAPDSPGYLLQYALNARHWMQKDLAEIIGRPMQLVSEVIGGKKEITRETAAQLGAALGTTPEFWLDAQDAYKLHLLSQDEAHRRNLEKIRQRAEQAANRPQLRLDPEDFPGLTLAQVKKLERMARRMGRQTRDTAAGGDD